MIIEYHIAKVIFLSNDFWTILRPDRRHQICKGNFTYSYEMNTVTVLNSQVSISL
jgi:hypothetical protein